MRYSPEGADDMHDCVVMIYQACGLDKKILVPKNEDFLAGMDGIEPSQAESKSAALPLGYTPILN